MRSKWKGAYVANSLINKISQLDSKSSIKIGPQVQRTLRDSMGSLENSKSIGQSLNKVIRITERSSMITPLFLNKNVEIHNGKEFKKVIIKDEYIGLKFGELAHTKKIPKYKNGTKN